VLVLLSIVFGKEEQGLDYYGNDIRNYKVTSKEVCRADCEKDMSCKLWLVLATDEEEGYDYPGHSVKWHTSGASLTKAECIQDCVQTLGCHRWLFIEGFTEGLNYCWAKNGGATNKELYAGRGKAFSSVVNMTCFLKNKVGRKTKYNGEGKTISEIMGEREQGWDYYGNDIRDYPVSTKEVCRKDCEEDLACKVWLVVATVEEEGYSYFVHSIKWPTSGASLTKAQCIQDCKQTHGCRRWSFIEGYKEGVNYCWALNGDTNKERYEGRGKAFSAAVNAGVQCYLKGTVGERTVYNGEGTTFSGLMFEEEPGLDYAGGDIRPGREGLSKTECILECIHTRDCKIWTYIEGFRDNNNYCFIKKKEGYMDRTEYRGPGSAFSGSVGIPRFTKTQCHWKSIASNPNCCDSNWRRCGLGEGDCDSDAECQDGLVCGNANCPGATLLSPADQPTARKESSGNNDCCHYPGQFYYVGCGRIISEINPRRWGWYDWWDRCCSSGKKCGLNEGDCDWDGECQSGLECGTNNCPGSNWSNMDDCCV